MIKVQIDFSVDAINEPLVAGRGREDGMTEISFVNKQGIEVNLILTPSLIKELQFGLAKLEAQSKILN